VIKLRDLLKEVSERNDFIELLLAEIQPMIKDIIALQKQKAEEDGITFSKYDEHTAELTLKYDLIKALGNYTQPSDKVVRNKVSNSNKGTLTISAVIERDGKEYPFHTDVIYAGGYNIQKLHFRYLTKTTLPRVNSNPEADKLKAELAKLSKEEKLRKQIEEYEKNIKLSKARIEQNSELSNEEIYKLVLADDKGRYGYIKPDSSQEQIDKAIGQWKLQNIEWVSKYVKANEAEIEKVQKKLNQSRQ
jgi:hypothetical protein